MSGNRVWWVLPSAILVILVGFAVSPDDTPPPGTLLSARLDPPPIPHPCARGATSPFTPTTIDIQHVAKRLPILALPRDGYDVPRTPPVSAKHTVAWDAPGNKPGGEHGNVLLNAHTWPDGSALGNAMLAHVHKGDILTLRAGATKLCYRVTRRTQVPAWSDYADFWVEDGPPQAAMIVCSGRRLGPGNWSHRTIWFATPYFGPKPLANRAGNGRQDPVQKAG